MALSLTIWPALACLALLSKSVVGLLVGHAWDEAAPVVTILAICRMCALFQVLLEPILGSRGRTFDILKINASSAAGSVALLAVLAHLGLLGAASAQLIVNIILAITGIMVGLHFAQLRWRDLVQTLLPGIAATAAAVAGAAAVVFAPIDFPSPIIRMIVIVVAGVLAWGCVLFLVFRKTILQRRLAISL
jgi:O-antigen/teichoic acid export membrane protein